VYLDIEEEGWACADSSASTRAAACTAGGGALRTLFGTQCVCTTHATTYPVGTERMSVAFSHAFSTSEVMDSLSGSSALRDGVLASTTIAFRNGTAKHFAEGESVRLTLEDWLKAGGLQGGLDERNYAVAPDATDASRHPYVRTTGVSVILDIEYSNLPSSSDIPEFGFRHQTSAIVRPRIEKTWAGLAMRAPIYEGVPSGAEGARSYRKLLRYSQGIVFKIQGSGIIYRLDVTHLVTTLTSTIVMLGLATTLTGLVGKYLWPTRQMIYNKSVERLAIGERLAEIALKAATYATTFANLEHTGDNKVDIVDLVHNFAKAGAPLSPEEAHAIGALIIARANANSSDKTLDFVEYMECLEAGSTIPFERFKDVATQFARDKGYVKMTSKVAPASHVRIGAPSAS